VIPLFGATERCGPPGPTGDYVRKVGAAVSLGETGPQYSTPIGNHGMGFGIQMGRCMCYKITPDICMRS